MKINNVGVLVFYMHRVYRKISEQSESLKEIFMSTMDLMPGDIVKNEYGLQLTDGSRPAFVKIKKMDTTRRADGLVGFSCDPCDDPSSRVVNNAPSLRA